MTEARFHQKIYTKKAVQKAAEAYAHLARFRIKREAPYLLVSISNQSDLEDELLRDEFCNYALYMRKATAG